MAEKHKRIISSLFFGGLLALTLIFPTVGFAQSYGGGNYGANEYGGTDNASPSISILAPSNGQGFTVGATVTITASSSDPDGSIAQVEFFVDNVSIGTTSNPYTTIWTAVGAASHTISAVATDNEGSQATSTITITVTSSSSGEVSGGSSGSKSVTANTSIVIPVLDPNATPEERETYRQILIVLIQKILSQIQSQQSGTGTLVYSFIRDLTIGSESLDVQQLQIFLNSKGYIVSATGPGSVGQESTYFGDLTRKQLARFQFAHNILPAVGFFGPITRALINGMLR